MNIMNLDVQDGRGPIRVVVGDAIEESRLRQFMRDSREALEEKQEREMMNAEVES